MSPAIVYFFPIALVIYIVMFFIVYFLGQRPKKGSIDWIKKHEKPTFTFALARHRLTRRDALILCVITAVYAICAFVYLGGMKNPQTFHRFSSGKDNAVTIDMGQTHKISSIFYYSGLFHGDKGYTLEFSEDGESWRVQPKMPQPHSETFRWVNATLEESGSLTRYIRVSSEDKLELGEISVWTYDNGVTSMLDASSFTGGMELLDEQNTVPDAYSILNSSQFDEIYHARTAYEHIRGEYPYENTHPPLGKYIIGIGIRLFGMTPFGWRFMGTLFGILMVPIMYSFIKNMFGKTPVAACGTIIFAFDFMHFVQTRIATIDVYGVFFILCMYWFMYRYVTSGYDAPFHKTMPSLALCGLSFGLGAASKWICLYAGGGLLIIYALYLYRRYRYSRLHMQDFGGFLFKTLAWSALFFLAVPAVIYVACYIPYATANGGALTLSRVLEECLKNQTSMFSYHSYSVLGSTHGFSSRWYSWIFDERPILYYANYLFGEKGTISAFSSPLLAWAGLVAIAACVVSFIRKNSMQALFILIGYLSQLLPWITVQRLTFAYHYFPSLVFCVLALCLVFSNMLDAEVADGESIQPLKKMSAGLKRMYTFTGISVALFILFYPSLTGVVTPDWYFNYLLHWLWRWQL